MLAPTALRLTGVRLSLSCTWAAAGSQSALDAFQALCSLASKALSCFVYRFASSCRHMVSSTESRHVLQQRATISSMLLASARPLTAQAVSMFAMHATHDSADGQPSATKDHRMCTFFTCDDVATAAAACCSSPELFM
jgi:hypothetical protein